MRKSYPVKRIFAVLTVLLMIFPLAACTKSPEPEEAVTGVRMSAYGKRKVAVFGDSIAAGYGLTSQSANYVTLFSSNIGATCKNLAVSGYDSTDVLDTVLKNEAVVEYKDADIIVLSVGGNDILHQKDLMISTIKNAVLENGEYFTAPIEAIYTNLENNLRMILTQLTAVNPDALIILQNVYNPAQKQGYYISVINASKYVAKYLDRLNETLQGVASEYGTVMYLDVADRMNKDEKNFYDLKTDFDIHPTEYGHATLANIYTEAFNGLYPNE